MANYISTENDRFQPMNANFGILPSLPERIKDKKIKYQKMAERSLRKLERQASNISGNCWHNCNFVVKYK